MHSLGFFAHVCYVLILMVYIKFIYIDVEKDQAKKRIFEIMLAVGLAYPAAYDFTQFYREGARSYLSDIGNYFDMIYIWSGVINVILQNNDLSFSLGTKICMAIIVTQMIYKTFFFLRIYEDLSYIVTMLANVIYDLRIFLLFYFIMIVLFA